MGRPKSPREFDRRFWAGIRAGLGVTGAAAEAGMSLTSAKQRFRKAGGVNPTRRGSPVGRYLSWSEREEIAALVHAGHGVREIARRLGRSPGTISRERDRGATAQGYRASIAQARADAGRSAPRAAKLATNLRLRREVQARLERRDSPEQIAGRLKIDFPDEPEMWVSAETIYQSLYVQARGGLKRELTAYLRTGRSVRKPRRREGERRGRIPGMVSISERPPEVEDQAVPGHWEGDLILGSVASASAVGTLVERTTGFVMLLHLPENHGALAVQEALVAKMATLPEQLRLSLTWDQGNEMANHAQIAEATGLEIYFCDPHSPWQRGSNENTNGLLRQYLPKGSDLSFYGPGMLDNIAAELNSRPRKRHSFQTPAEVLDQLLSEAATNHGVA
ncbi:IS30 family transposase [Nocardioides luteus]|uniref:IS30 family transposase n=2 Tax=Nocardioides luteus TaxID=1844 RepID=A0ABQ5SZ75_9ACTN|nr:IS30 family transposase [Nocardioides luteus]GLJ68762.1 IS30 family transposase [Nocardioides luteus]